MIGIGNMQTKKIFNLYRLRNKKTKHDAFNTWFTSSKKAFGSMKAKHNRYNAPIQDYYNPENYEAVEYLITEVRTLNVDEE